MIACYEVLHRARAMKHVPRTLLLVFALLGAVAYLLLAYSAIDWLLLRGDRNVGQDFEIYHAAFVEASEGGNPYQPLQIGVSYINHPFLLSLVGVSHWIGGEEGARWVWISLSALIWIGVLWKIVPYCSARRWNKPAYWFAFLFFAPVLETLLIGQVNIFAIFALLLMLMLDLDGKPWWAGVFLALAFILKTSPGAFALLYLVTGRWRVLAGALLGLVVFTSLSTLQFGTTVLWQWIDILPELGGIIRDSKANQSVLALAYRQLEPLGWSGLREALLLLHKLGFLCLLGYVLWWGYRLKAGGRDDQVWVFAALLSLITVFSPLVWLHHSVFLIPALALMLSSPTSRMLWMGVACLFLIQGTRVFELKVTSHAWTALLAHILITWTILRGLPRLVSGATGSSAPAHHS